METLRVFPGRERKDKQELLKRMAARLHSMARNQSARQPRSSLFLVLPLEVMSLPHSKPDSLDPAFPRRPKKPAGIQPYVGRGSFYVAACNTAKPLGWSGQMLTNRSSLTTSKTSKIGSAIAHITNLPPAFWIFLFSVINLPRAALDTNTTPSKLSRTFRLPWLSTRSNNCSPRV